MKNKLQFLILEDKSVRLLSNPNVKALYNIIPDSWIKIISAESTEARCQAVIELWKKYLGSKLPNVMDRFDAGLENVELLRHDGKEGERYSLLYSVINEEGKCIYYEGRNPLDNMPYRSKLNYWKNLPERIRNFYEKIHDGFYHYMNRGMGLQPIMFTRFRDPEDEELEWNLDFEPYGSVLDEDSHDMAFFWNSLGIAVSIDDKDESENNAIIWKSDSPCEFNADFWKIVDLLLLYF